MNEESSRRYRFWTVAIAVAGALASPSPAVAVVFCAAVAGVTAWALGIRNGVLAGAAGVAAVMAAFPPARSAGIIMASVAAMLTLAATAHLARLQARRSAVAAAPAPRSGSGVLGVLGLARSVPALAAYAGLPLLTAILYTNLSDVVARRVPIPSLLQPLIVVLAIVLWFYRSRFRPGAVIASPLVLLAAAWCTLLFAAGVWAPDATLADARVGEAVRGLVIMTLVGSLAADWKALRLSLAAVAVAAAALGTLTLAQALTTRSDFDFGGLARGETAHIYGAVSGFRAGGPVGDPNFYAQILLVALPIALAMAWSGERRGHKLAFLAAAALIACATILTYSRGAMLALGVVAMLIVGAFRLPLRYVVPAALAVLLLMPETVVRRLLPFGGRDAVVVSGVARDSSFLQRKLDAAVAMRMFDDNIILGAGTAGFGELYTRYATEVGTSARLYRGAATPYPHSLYLEIAAENGAVGLLLFGTLVTVAIAGLLDARKRLIASASPYALFPVGIAIALAGYLATSVFLHGAFQRYFWLLLGFALAVIRLAREPETAVLSEEVTA